MSLADSDVGRESDLSNEAFDDAQEGPSKSFDDALTHIVKEGGNDMVQYLLSIQIADKTVPVIYKDVVKIKATNPDSYKQWIVMTLSHNASHSLSWHVISFLLDYITNLQMA